MKHIGIIVGLCLLLVGCVTTPVISKSKIGNLEVHVLGQDNSPIHYADVFIDEIYIGNLSDDLPVIHAKRGLRTIRVECEGFETEEKAITILGDPNHQVLYVFISPK